MALKPKKRNKISRFCKCGQPTFEDNNTNKKNDTWVSKAYCNHTSSKVQGFGNADKCIQLTRKIEPCRKVGPRLVHLFMYLFHSSPKGTQ